MDKMPKHASIKELFEILRDSGQGISENMIRRHIDKAGINKGKDGKWNVSDVLEAILKHRSEDNKNGSMSEKDPRRLKAMLQCQLLKIEIDRQKGDLIDKNEVDGMLREMAVAVRGQLLALPNALAPHCEGKDVIGIAEVLRKGVTDCLRHIADGGE